MFLLQSVVICEDDRGKEKFACLRGVYQIVKESLKIEQGDQISFDTFYNIFSLPVWKKKCGVTSITVVFVGTGRVVVELASRDLDNKDKTVLTKEMDLGQEHTISFSFEELLDTDILFLKISALSAVSISEINYCTNDKPKREVKLGIGITHYNRVQEVTENVNKLYSKLSKDPSLEGKYEICVVDNSSNLDKNSLPPVTVIPSKNFGGSGGFMRALMHFQEDLSFTHVLFMDDDAKCEVESIRRTIAIMQYVSDEATALCGTLFFRESPMVIVEKGAYFDFFRHPRCSGLDVARKENLTLLESFSQKINYGAWCYFCFPTKQVKHYSFPFFVRGDDINFSITNPFLFMAPSGIACYVDNFNDKWSEKFAYFDVRSHLVNTLSNENFLKAPIYYGYKSLLWILASQSSHFFAARLALKHVFSGKDFWISHMEGETIFRELKFSSSKKSICDVEKEKRKKITVDHVQLNDPLETREWKGIIRLLLLNGVYLPQKRRCIRIPLKKTISLKSIFRYKYIFYDFGTGDGLFVEVSRRRIFSNLFLLAEDLFLIMIKSFSLHNSYKNLLKEFGSKEYWETLFKSAK